MGLTVELEQVVCLCAVCFAQVLDVLEERLLVEVRHAARQLLLWYAVL